MRYNIVGGCHRWQLALGLFYALKLRFVVLDQGQRKEILCVLKGVVSVNYHERIWEIKGVIVDGLGEIKYFIARYNSRHKEGLLEVIAETASIWRFRQIRDW